MVVVYRGVVLVSAYYSIGGEGEVTIREGATELSCSFRSEQSRDVASTCQISYLELEDFSGC